MCRGVREEKMVQPEVVKVGDECECSQEPQKDTAKEVLQGKIY